MNSHFKTIVLGLILSLIAGCKSEDNPTDLKIQCFLDANKLHSWAEFGTLQQPNMPYFRSYEGCGKSLHYIAAAHDNNPDGATFKMIANVLESHAIDFIVVEGFPSAYGISDPGMLDYSKSVEGTLLDSEAYLTIRLAEASGINFQGGEPSEIEIIQALKSSDIELADLLGFYIVRQIPQLIREGQINDVNDKRLEGQIKNLIDGFVSETGIARTKLASIDGITHFRQWYKNTNNIELSAGFREDDAWPSSAVAEPRPTNFISDIIGDIRDRHIVEVINRSIRDNSVVLVVYGGSHHVIHEPALSAVFNAGSFQ